MTRQEMIDLLSNALRSAEAESQLVVGAEEEEITVLTTPTGRIIVTLLEGEAEVVRAILENRGGDELAAFVVDLLLDQIKCEWCPTNLEKPTQELVGFCGGSRPVPKHATWSDLGSVEPDKPRRRWFGWTPKW